MAGRLCILSVVLVLAVSGCTVTSSHLQEAEQQRNPLPGRLSMPHLEKSDISSPEGSIYNEEASLDFYQDGRARQVGDIVLVKIVETSSGKKKASTKTERESTLSGGVASLFGVEKWLSDKNRNFTPSSTSLEASLQNDFDGTGETKRDSTVTATLSARVMDKTMDGNLYIRGYREVRVNNETQFLILSGIVRPQDITPDNSILSSYIADARIEYSGKGVVSDKQQPGWLARGLDILWPF